MPTFSTNIGPFILLLNVYKLSIAHLADNVVLDYETQVCTRQRNCEVVLSGLVVMCLLFDLRFAASDPADGDGFLMTLKIHSMTSFGGEAVGPMS
jgi:hypothetical protein